MKKTTIHFLVFFVILLGSKSTKAQLALEAIHDSAATGSSYSGSLAIVNLEVDGEKYCRIIRTTTLRRIDFYNLDHSYWKGIDCNSFPMLSSLGPSPTPIPFFYAMYISQHLFNSDDAIEFLFYTSSGGSSNCRIYDETGNIFQNFDGQAPNVYNTAPHTQLPLYNTSQGAKLILSNITDGKAYVYSLPGTLTEIQTVEAESKSYMNTFPNPSKTHTTIDYKLPENCSNGEISIYDNGGNLLRMFTVDHSFSNLILNNDEFAQGQYIVTLKTKDSLIWKKQIILK